MNKMTHCIRNHYFVAFFVTLTISIGLIIGGFFAPPQGEIDGSVLKGVGELFLWPALAFAAKALDDDKKIKIHQGNTTIVVGERKIDDDNETVEELPGVDDAGEGEVTEDE